VSPLRIKAEKARPDRIEYHQQFDFGENQVAEVSVVEWGSSPGKTDSRWPRPHVSIDSLESSLTRCFDIITLPTQVT